MTNTSVWCCYKLALLHQWGFSSRHPGAGTQVGSVMCCPLVFGSPAIHFNGKCKQGLQEIDDEMRISLATRWGIYITASFCLSVFTLVFPSAFFMLTLWSPLPASSFSLLSFFSSSVPVPLHLVTQPLLLWPSVFHCFLHHASCSRWPGISFRPGGLWPSDHPSGERGRQHYRKCIKSHSSLFWLC